MRNFPRKYPLFSLCGLNCGLCPMFHISEQDHCPGCCEKRPSCAVTRCALEHGGVEFCSLCPAYPCERYPDHPYDSFVPYRNVKKDFEQANAMGIDSYMAMLDEKVGILRFLLANYNDGRRKSFFCTAVNLLDLADVKEVMAQIRQGAQPDDLKAKAARAAALFQAKADERHVSLKLNKKKPEKDAGKRKNNPTKEGPP